MQTRRKKCKTSDPKSKVEIYSTTPDYLVVGANHFRITFLRGKGPQMRKEMTLSRYTNILKTVMDLVWKSMMEDLWRFEIPHVGNEVFILECIGPGTVMDWNLTKKYRKRILMHNLHSNRRLFKVAMRRTHKSARITRVYKFVPSIVDSKFPHIGTRRVGQYIKRLSEDITTPDFRGHIC